MNDSVCHKCGYCGSATHCRCDCPRELKATGRWNEVELHALNRLCALERDCMRYGIHLTECPMAVREYAKLGRTFKGERSEISSNRNRIHGKQLPL